MNKSDIRKAGRILNHYDLCLNCLGRQFPPNNISNRNLGKKIKTELGIQLRCPKCSICNNILNKTSSLANRSVSLLSSYEFDTFQIGSMIDNSLIENEDSLRAEFKLRGGETIKTELIRELSKLIIKKTNKERKTKNYDLYLLIDFIHDDIAITPSPVIVEGRYTKSERGIRQKRIKCDKCSDLGCKSCNYTGYKKTKTIESKISTYFKKKFLCTDISINWIGTEDINSIVEGSGRMFVADIIKPQLRTPILRKKKLGKGIQINSLQILAHKPSTLPKFRLKIKANVITDKLISKKDAKILEDAFSNREIKIYSARKQKYVLKQIYDLKILSSRRKKLEFESFLDSGINIRKLVNGFDNHISPNISGILGVKCTIDDSEPFDILESFSGDSIDGKIL